MELYSIAELAKLLKIPENKVKVFDNRKKGK